MMVFDTEDNSLRKMFGSGVKRSVLSSSWISASVAPLGRTFRTTTKPSSSYCARRLGGRFIGFLMNNSSGKREEEESLDPVIAPLLNSRATGTVTRAHAARDLRTMVFFFGYCMFSLCEIDCEIEWVKPGVSLCFH